MHIISPRGDYRPTCLPAGEELAFERLPSDRCRASNGTTRQKGGRYSISELLFESSHDLEMDGSPWTASPPLVAVDALRASQAVGRSPVANGQAQLRHTTLIVGASLSCGLPRA